MSKEMIFNIANKLRPFNAKNNTRYRFTILVEVMVACVIYN
jgi:hypothetical protein